MNMIHEDKNELSSSKQAKTAKRVYWGSCEPEYYLYLDGVHKGFWGCYHQGPLPKEYTVVN